jgi:hypothetical protein
MDGGNGPAANDEKKMNAPARFPNKYAATCTACNGKVAVGEGLTVKVAGKWAVTHKVCPVKVAAPVSGDCKCRFMAEGTFDADCRNDCEANYNETMYG